MLDTEVIEFMKATKRHWVFKVNPERTAAWVVSWVEDPYPPIRLSVLIGDCVFNMRSALDNVVCALIRRATPEATCSGTQFPICDDRAKHKPEMLRGVPEGARRMIVALQPYNRPENSIAVDPLNILNLLSNRDKHRAVNLTAGFSKNTQLDIFDEDAGGVWTVQVPRLHKEIGPQTIPVPVPVGPVGKSIRVDTSGRAVLAFRDDGPWDERPVTEVLQACLTYIDDRVIGGLKPFFKN
jgi:hypothetical protein